MSAELLRAVLDDPWADAPRLVYADWLEETAGVVPCGRCNGAGWHYVHQEDREICSDCSGSGRVPDGRQAMAEFIRVQVELAMRQDYAGTNESQWSPELRERMAALRRRERELLDRWEGGGGDLFPGLPGGWVVLTDRPRSYSDADLPLAVARRGFVEEVICTAADWLALGPQIVACQPVLSVRLSDRPAASSQELVDWARKEAGLPGGSCQFPFAGRFSIASRTRSASPANPNSSSRSASPDAAV